MIVELSFLTGRFHATPWGRHVNEAVPEWPPAPFRILRALLDVWYRKHPDISADAVERVLQAMSSPPVYALPRARASHTRSYLSQNDTDPSDKKLVFDGFAVVDRGSVVHVGWPRARLNAPDLDVARQLFDSLNYLGRSESWVRARVIDDVAMDWNCAPLTPGAVPPGREVVSVAGVVPPDAFAARAFELPAKGKAKARRLGWFEALGWGSAEAIEHTMNRPPALEPIFYVRNSDALDARPRVVARQSSRVVQVVEFAVDGRVPAPLTDALHVGEQVRRNLMGALRKVLGHDRLPSTFTGKTEDGHPVRGHTHASILPLDEDGDGFIDAILVTAPEGFSSAEQRAVDRLAPVRRKNGHHLVLTPVRYGKREELLRTATKFVSHTPFAPLHHWRLKRDGDEATWLARQFSLECQQRGLPAPLSAKRVPPGAASHRRARWLDYRRARKADAPQPAYGLEVTFAEPVLAPFSVGYASHYGLGIFIERA